MSALMLLQKLDPEITQTIIRRWGWYLAFGIALSLLGEKMAARSLGMDLWLRQPLRADLCGLPDAEADAQAERVILPRDRASQRCCVGDNHASDTTRATTARYYCVGG